MGNQLDVSAGGGFNLQLVVLCFSYFQLLAFVMKHSGQVQNKEQTTKKSAELISNVNFGARGGFNLQLAVHARMSNN